MIRDREIDRLINYCQAFNIKVIFNTEMDSDAEWTLDGTEIRINRTRNSNKTDLILTLIHELGHHLWFVYKKERQPDLKFDEAITREFFSENRKSNTPKRLRKKILDIEREGLRYWDIVVKDTDIKIPTWKIEMQKEFDIWQYEVYYKTAKFRRQKLKQLVNKYKINK
jgi:oligoendopeptidase F